MKKSYLIKLQGEYRKVSITKVGVCQEIPESCEKYTVSLTDHKSLGPGSKYATSSSQCLVPNGTPPVIYYHLAP